MKTKRAHKVITTDTGIEFLLGKRLGKGKYGEVFAAEKLTNHNYNFERPFAFKLLPEKNFQDEDDRRGGKFMYSQEFQMLRDFQREAPELLGHMTLVYDVVGFLNMNERPGIIMERLSGRSLSCLKLYRQKNIGLLIEVAKVLEELHKIGWMHCDVAEKNILFRNGCDLGITKAKTVLADGGFARKANKNEWSDLFEGYFVGTPYYLDVDAYDGAPTESSDVYALGIVTAHILAYEAFPLDKNVYKMYNLIKVREHRQTRKSAELPGLDYLLSGTITERAYGRPTAKQFAEELQKLYKKTYGVSYVFENAR